MIGKVSDTIQLAIHCAATAMDNTPLMLLGKISDRSTQVTGPQLMAKAAVYASIKISARRPTFPE